MADDLPSLIDGGEEGGEKRSTNVAAVTALLSSSRRTGSIHASTGEFLPLLFIIIEGVKKMAADGKRV